MPPTPPKNLDVWILAGQSNMEGFGLLRDGLLPDERVWVFSSAGNWEIAEEPLHRLWESFTENHPDRLRAENTEATGHSNQTMANFVRQTQVTGSGLGLSFAIEMAEKSGRPIGLIPCAHGGTSLSDWTTQGKTTADLYGGLLERVRQAGGELRGLLWYQGESDTNPTAAMNYGHEFAAWIEELRHDLAAPKLPVFVVQLGRLIETPTQNIGERPSLAGWETMREVLVQLPIQIKHCQVTSAIDLGLHDTIHLDGASLIRLGRRLVLLASGLESPTVTTIVRDREEEQIRGGRGIIQVCCDTHGAEWKKIHPLSGFTLHDASGQIHPDIALIQAEVAGNDPTALRLITHRLPDETVRIGYGMGLNPFCNVVTELDLPLPAFVPRPIA